MRRITNFLGWEEMLLEEHHFRDHDEQSWLYSLGTGIQGSTPGALLQQIPLSRHSLRLWAPTLHHGFWGRWQWYSKRSMNIIHDKNIDNDLRLPSTPTHQT